MVPPSLRQPPTPHLRSYRSRSAAAASAVSCNASLDAAHSRDGPPLPWGTLPEAGRVNPGRVAMGSLAAYMETATIGGQTC